MLGWTERSARQSKIQIAGIELDSLTRTVQSGVERMLVTE